MSALTTISDNGLIAVLVDAGRHGYEHLGVPVAGPMHTARYLDCCYLAGQPEGGQAVEMHAGTWEFATDTATVLAVVGDAVSVVVDGMTMAAGCSLELPAHALVRITYDSAHGHGPAYVSVSGLQAEQTLGSASTDTFSGLGTPALHARQSLPLHEPASSLGELRFTQPEKRRRGRVLVHAGPWELPVAEFSLEVASVSRSGIRFAPAQMPLVAQNSGAISSFPVFPGAVQVPPSNAPIVLGPDAGTTGGYPVVGVIDADGLATLSELRPGDRVVFGTLPSRQAATVPSMRHAVN